MQEISNATRGEAMIITCVGQHQMRAAQYYMFTHPQEGFTYGHIGTMGCGLHTAIGAQAAHDGQHVCVAEDECVWARVPAGGGNPAMILAPPTRGVRDRAEKSQTGF